MKGIVRDLGEIKIPLKLDANPFKHRPYRLNPRYKEKVKEKLDCMLNIGIIEPVEESKWINPIVIHDKKTTGEFGIYLDLRKLNDACLHDPFPTPFTYEILESVGGQDMYSFIDGFSRYHKFRIAKEDHHKTTFVIEWGCYQYTVMPFGLKNAPAIFLE